MVQECFFRAMLKVRRLSTLFAISLNIISTVLIATSNYVMQCMCAPSRKEIDKAHAAGSFLNIGVSSMHNFDYNFDYNFSWKSFLWLPPCLQQSLYTYC